MSIETLAKEARRQVVAGNSVDKLSTAFPRNPPPSGIAYSKNFARCQQYGKFATQVKE